MQTQHRALHLSRLCRSWTRICCVHKQQQTVVGRWWTGIEAKCCQCCGHQTGIWIYSAYILTHTGLNKSKRGCQRKSCNSDNPLPLPAFSSALLNNTPLCYICLLTCWHESFQKRQFEWSRGALHFLQIHFYTRYSNNVLNSTVILPFQLSPFKKRTEFRSFPGMCIVMQDMPQ